MTVLSASACKKYKKTKRNPEKSLKRKQYVSKKIEINAVKGTTNTDERRHHRQRGYVQIFINQPLLTFEEEKQFLLFSVASRKDGT